MKLQDSIPATPNDPNSNLTQYPMEENSTPQRKTYVRKIWKIVAIIEAVCILVMCLVFAWSHMDFYPHKSMEKIGAVTFNDQGFENLSSVPGYPFTFDAPGEFPYFWSIRVNHYGFDVKKTPRIGRAQ